MRDNDIGISQKNEYDNIVVSILIYVTWLVKYEYLSIWLI